jgi:hypothetical protein
MWRLGGTKVVHNVRLGKEFLSGSLPVSSMEQLVCVHCMGRRGGEMGDSGYIFDLFLRIK